MPGRKFSAGNGYRYGFNGKENDNEVKGEGNQQDYGMRVYDPRIGKFLSVDPLSKNYPSLTPYQFASNSPIKCIDLDGLEGDPVQDAVDFLNGVWDDLTSKKRWIEAARNVNETINPLYFIPNDASKIILKKDLEGNPIDFRGRLGATSDAGVGIMGYVTGERFFRILGGYGTNALEAELNSSSRKLLQSEAKPAVNKPALTAADDVSLKQQQPVQQWQSSAGGTTNVSIVKAKDLKLLHSEETIVKSADYNKIKNLSDEELIKSVTKPANYKKVTINTKTGTLVDGNTRIYEIQRRKLDVNVPVEKYTPDDSAFPQLKEPRKR